MSVRAILHLYRHPESLRVPHACQRGSEWPMVLVKGNMEMLKQTTNGRALQENQLTIADHHLLMTIANLMREVRPFLRCLRSDHIYRLDGFSHRNDCLFGIQNHAVAAFEDGSGGKGNCK